MNRRSPAPGLLLACFGVASIAACGRSGGFMTPSGTQASSLARLGWFLTGCAVVTVVVVALLVVAALAHVHRQPNRDAEPVRTGGESAPPTGLRWIYVGTAITIIVLALASVLSLRVLAHAERPSAPPNLTVEVTGSRWWWEFRYPGDSDLVTANELHVPTGTPVRLRIKSSDVIHSFWVPELAGKTDLVPGQINDSWIQVDRPGRYRGQCAEYCGQQHAHMGLEVIAESPSEFAAWRERQARAAPLVTGAILQGQRRFIERCAGCHTVRGTSASGRIGPDLTHVASRSTIAASMLANTKANLAGWIADAQHIKPGSLMPTLPLAPSELIAVLSYLETLR